MQERVELKQEREQALHLAPVQCFEQDSGLVLELEPVPERESVPEYNSAGALVLAPERSGWERSVSEDYVRVRCA